MDATRVHETAFVGPGVELGAGVVVGPFAVLLGPATVGDHVWVGPGVHLGGAPEMSSERRNLAWDGDLDHHAVVVGDHTVLRDGVVVHHGSWRPTTVGSHCQLFSRAYVAHDVVVGDRVTLSAGVSIGGHATVRDGANLGLNASVHQRRSVGALAMVGMGTPVTRDVPPFVQAYGSPVRVHALNAVGLRRAGVDDDDLERLAGLLRADGSDSAAGVESATDGSGWHDETIAGELHWWHTLPDRMPARLAGAPAVVPS